MLELQNAENLRPGWLGRLLAWGLVRSSGKTAAVRYFVDPEVFKGAGLEGKTTLVRMAPIARPGRLLAQNTVRQDGDRRLRRYWLCFRATQGGRSSSLHCLPPPANRHQRQESERFRHFRYDELVARDKASLDIFWLKDDCLDKLDDLPPPDVLQQVIVEHLEAALLAFRDVAAALPRAEPSAAHPQEPHPRGKGRAVL